MERSTFSLLHPPPLQRRAEVSTFVTTRHGGVGEGTYSSFNCSPYCGDEAAHVSQNLTRLQHLLGESYAPFIIARQVHGTTVCRIDTAFLSFDPDTRNEQLQGVDALITDTPHCTLCISTADCLPVFFVDPRHRVIGLAHAGWRGTVQHIARITLQTLRNNYGTHPEDLYVAIGPCISQAAFEVGEEVYETFQKEGFDMSQIARRHPETGKWHLSLADAITQELRSAGMKKECIDPPSYCTYTHSHTFFSARRLGIQSGRILSGISLCPTPSR